MVAEGHDSRRRNPDIDPRHYHLRRQSRTPAWLALSWRALQAFGLISIAVAVHWFDRADRWQPRHRLRGLRRWLSHLGLALQENFDDEMLDLPSGRLPTPFKRQLLKWIGHKQRLRMKSSGSSPTTLIHIMRLLSVRALCLARYLPSARWPQMLSCR